MTVPKMILWNHEWNPESIDTRMHLLEILSLSKHFYTAKKAFELIASSIHCHAESLQDVVLVFSRRFSSDFDSLKEALDIIQLTITKIGLHDQNGIILGILANQFLSRKDITNHAYFFNIFNGMDILSNENFQNSFLDSGLIALVRQVDGLKISNPNFGIILDFLINACKTRTAKDAFLRNAHGLQIVFRWLSLTLNDELLFKVLKFLDDLIPRIPSKIFYKYQGLRSLLGMPMCSNNFMITEKILQILIKLSERDQELFKNIMVKDGNHQQIMNVIHRIKNKSDHSDIYHSIQQKLKIILDIIEKPKERKPAFYVVNESPLIIPEKLKELVQALPDPVPDIKEENDTKKEIIQSKRRSTIKANNRSSQIVVENEVSRPIQSTLQNQQAVKRRSTGFRKFSELQNVVKMPTDTGHSESVSLPAPRRRSSRRRTLNTDQKNKFILPKVESEPFEKANIEEILQKLKDDDCNRTAAALYILHKDLSTDIYTRDEYYWLASGLLIHLQNESEAVCTLASKCLARICEIESAKESLMRTDILTYIPDMLKDVNLSIVLSGLKMLVQLSSNEQVIDLLCQPDIIYLLQEMNITSNNLIRISTRSLLDIVRTSMINFIKALEKVDSLAVNAWEALFLQWYPLWESNQAQCI